jgi:exopolyphosphatase/guanosine-5'-triphosphate,3'-diphosphate pyrophosphatase
MVAPGNPPGKREYALLETAVENQIERSHLPAVARKTHVLGVAGTMRAILDARRASLGDADGFSFRDLERILRDARSMTHEEMGSRLKLDERRAQIFIPGALIMRGIMELYGITRVSVSAGGLRDGILQEMLDETDHVAPHDAGLFAERIGEKYGFDRAHGAHVAFLVGRLFDQTAGLHKLDGEHREMLTLAALLHDIGQFVSYSRHHKHSHYLLLNEEFPGLTPARQQVLAAVCRYHRKSDPSARHPEYAALGAEARETVGKLAALLRIADGLDREHRQLVADLQVAVSRDTVAITCLSSRPVPLELSSAAGKAELFARVFGRRVILGSIDGAGQEDEQGE